MTGERPDLAELRTAIWRLSVLSGLLGGWLAFLLMSIIAGWWGAL